MSPAVQLQFVRFTRTWLATSDPPSSWWRKWGKISEKCDF